MELKENHIKIGHYAIQYNYANCYGCNEGFFILDTEQDNAQIGDAYQHLSDALEHVLKY